MEITVKSVYAKNFRLSIGKKRVYKYKGNFAQFLVCLFVHSHENEQCSIFAENLLQSAKNLL